MTDFNKCYLCLTNICVIKNKEIIKPFKLKDKIIYFISCDYCQNSATLSEFQNGNTIRIQYVKNNILFELDFHKNCFEHFKTLNIVEFCNFCKYYYSHSPSSPSLSSTQPSSSSFCSSFETQLGSEEYGTRYCGEDI